MTLEEEPACGNWLLLPAFTSATLTSGLFLFSTIKCNTNTRRRIHLWLLPTWYHQAQASLLSSPLSLPLLPLLFLLSPLPPSLLLSSLFTPLSSSPPPPLFPAPALHKAFLQGLRYTNVCKLDQACQRVCFKPAYCCLGLADRVSLAHHLLSY